jgi:flagellin
VGNDYTVTTDARSCDGRPGFAKLNSGDVVTLNDGTSDIATSTTLHRRTSSTDHVVLAADRTAEATTLTPATGRPCPARTTTAARRCDRASTSTRLGNVTIGGQEAYLSGGELSTNDPAASAAKPPLTT